MGLATLVDSPTTREALRAAMESGGGEGDETSGALRDVLPIIRAARDLVAAASLLTAGCRAARVSGATPF